MNEYAGLEKGVEMTRDDRIHFVGIGGSGMSGIAKVLLEMGYSVSGSDIKTSEAIRRLKRLGATIYMGHAAENLGDADIIVISSAIPQTNPEWVEAKRRHITVMQRAEMLAKIMEERTGIAVAGTHGKTTTTSMIALLLERCHQDPTVIIGGELNDIGGNAKLGCGKVAVAEADESDGSLINLNPVIAVITNIEADHLDYYKGIDDIVGTFQRFISRLPENGNAIICIDDRNAASLMKEDDSRFISYGFSPNADFQAREARFFKNRSVFECWHRGSLLGEVKLNVPGRHNIANALATLAVGVLLELPFKDMVSALACFRGVQRRFHVKGSINDITVIDDYAHHPSEIKATLQAAREGWEHRLVVAFQPHRYSRTKLLCNDFGQAFSDADVVIVTDIYPAGEAPIDGISARNVADLVSRYNPGKDIRYLPSQVDVLNALEEMVEPGDMVFTMGAGDIWLLGEELVKYLKTHTGEEEVLAVVR
jgi:UDP-N-acetylmuramate--alanine ligase